MSKLIYTGKELSQHNPELVDEWDYDKNYPVTPDDVSYGSAESIGGSVRSAVNLMRQVQIKELAKNRMPLLCRKGQRVKSKSNLC